MGEEKQGYDEFIREERDDEVRPGSIYKKHLHVSARVPLGLHDLSDPGVDRLMFWDDSEGGVKWLEPADEFVITDNLLEVDHDLTKNFVANEHIDWTNATVNLSTTGYVKTDSLYLFDSINTNVRIIALTTAQTADRQLAIALADSNITLNIQNDLFVEAAAVSRINQDLTTDASPTFAACSLSTGELTCGSINRASGQMTLEIGGTGILNTQAAGVGVFGAPTLTGLEVNHTTTCYLGARVDSDADAVGFRFMRSGGVSKDCTWYFYVPANQTYFSFYESAEQFRFYKTGEMRFHGFDTESLTLEDAGSAGATEQDWIEVTVGGVTGYIRVYAAK